MLVVLVMMMMIEMNELTQTRVSSSTEVGNVGIEQSTNGERLAGASFASLVMAFFTICVLQYVRDNDTDLKHNNS